MIRQSERDAVLQRVDRQLVNFAECNCPIVLECEHIPVDRFERVNQRRVAIEVHRVLVRRPVLPVHSDSAAALGEVAGLTPF